MQRLVKCHSYIKRSARVSSTWSVPALCAAYHWPGTGNTFATSKKLEGGGIIAIIELGGGWIATDMAKYFESIGQPVPTITDISVDGTQNSKQNPQNDADYEVALDIQVAAAAYFCATGKSANIRVYWAQDIAPAVTAAANDGCSVCSISWGDDEEAWGNAELTVLAEAIARATTLGMVVFAASGDNDSSDGGPSSANVDAPASCPHTVGCGGTSKTPDSEVVWNNEPGQMNGEGTGGGYSTFFPLPAWQIGAPTPPPGLGRMVPDVAGSADPNYGDEIIVYGEQSVVGGTSAVAPLYAGFFAALGKGTKLGFLNPWLWRNQKCFNDITQGGNGQYTATIGPDPCSGIGSLIATDIANLL